MATAAEAEQAIIDRIAEQAPKMNRASSLLQCAEALAWLRDSGQPHGGSVTVSK